MGIIELLIVLIVVAAVVGILQAVGVPIPGNILNIIWIVMAAAVAIWAIYFLAGAVS